MKWDVIEKENGTPKSWRTELIHNQFVWIKLNPNGTYDIIVNKGYILTRCKTLISAKRWVKSKFITL